MSLPREADGGWRWSSLRLLHRVVLRLHHGWEAVPARARREWWIVLGAGFVVVELFVLGVVWAGRRAEAAGLLAWETRALERIDAQTLLTFNFAMWLEGIANGFVLWGVVLLAAGMAAWMRRPMRSVTLLTGYTLMYFPIVTGWTAWNRARPDLIAGGIGTPGGFFHSYPSGHTVQSVVAYGLLIHFWLRETSSASERAFALLVYAVLLSLTMASRLRLGAHWPSDVAAGVLIGGAWLAVLLLALRRVERAGGR